MVKSKTKFKLKNRKVSIAPSEPEVQVANKVPTPKELKIPSHVAPPELFVEPIPDVPIIIPEKKPEPDYKEYRKRKQPKSIDM